MPKCLGHRPTQLRARQRDISRLEINKAARLAIVGSKKAMAFSSLYWSNYTAGTSKLMKKSEVAVQSEHVLKFAFDKEAQFIRGIVQASMRDRSYQVTIAALTVGQKDNCLWSAVRRNRLTASNFGCVLAAVKRKRYPVSLFKRLCQAYDLSKKDAIIWGVCNERVAIDKYRSFGDAVVEPTGI
nr:uncharacterized protein LOC105344032 [Crassostrea gigas]